MTEATANLASVVASSPSAAIKISNPAYVVEEYEPFLEAEIMSDMIFEDIGGQEMINIARHDLVNGQDVVYQAIKNLANINFQYNPQNILALQDIDKSYFLNFPVGFEDKVPNCGTGYDLVPVDPLAITVVYKQVPNCKIVYIEPETGNLIINVINLQKDEQVEIEILNSGTVLDATIYRAV